MHSPGRPAGGALSSRQSRRHGSEDTPLVGARPQDQRMASSIDVIRTHVQPGLAPDPMIDAAGFGPAVVAGMKLPVVDDQLTVKQVQLFDPGMAVGRIVGSRREPHQHADAVLLRIGREQLAGDARAPRLSTPVPPIARGAGNSGSPPVSAAIRRARRSQSDADGRSTSVGQETKESMIGRSVSISCRQSAHAEICASTTGTSLEGRACRAYRHTSSEWSCPCWPDAELMVPSLSWRAPAGASAVRNGFAS